MSALEKVDKGELYRVKVLESYGIMNTEAEEEFDSIARLAAFICNKPESTITFLDDKVQFVKSALGFEIGAGPRDQSICQFTIQQDDILEIKDTLDDPRTENLSCVSGEAGIRYYLGVPLIVAGNIKLGSLCVVDFVPGELNVQQREALKILADKVVVQLESRKKTFELERLLKEHAEISAIFDASAELHLITDRSGCIRVMNKAVENLLGYTAEECIGHEIWEYLYKDDLKAMARIIEQGLRDRQKNFELEGRIVLKDGQYKWMGWSIASKKDSWYINGRDISEMKQLIADLEQLSIVANKVNNGVIISDKNSRVIWANQASEEITGYSLEDLAGKKLGDILAGEKTDLSVISSARELTKSKQAFTVDLLAYTKAGKPIWLSILNSVILDADGNIEKEVEVLIDITSRKEVELEMETLSLVASQSSSGIAIRDGEGRVTWVNAALEKLLGYSLAELEGKRMSEVVAGPETDQSVIEQTKEAIKLQQSYDIEIQAYAKDGHTVWLQCATTPILNEEGKIEKQVEIVLDITERKKIEEELTLLSLVASKTVNGVAISGADGRIKWVNKAFEDLTGYTLEEFKQTRPGDLLAGPDTDIGLLNDARKKATDCIPSNLELLNYKKDGTPIWLLVSNTPTFNKDGSLDQQVEIINDISERKLAEQELIKTREEALQLSKAKETFLSVMSHEIRTPLNAVIGMSHILMDDDPTESQKENLKILGFSAQNLLTLINDVLDFTKIETGNMVLESVDVNLKNLASQTLNSLQFKTAEKGVVLRSEIDYRIPTFVKGDNTRLYQILINLLGNSVKFTEEGEVKLRLELISENRKSVTVRFEISDTGIGIESDKIDYIFDSYTQASSDTTRKYGGTGLGLAITKSLVQLHHSKIEVTSEPGVGSVFAFNIEFNRSKETHEVEETQTNYTNLNAKILVVDDNEMNRILAGKVLKKWGVEVDFAENGRLALDMVKLKSYDMVLMDLHMPVMDGMNSSKQIRALGGEYRNLPIIALTASLFSHELDTIAKSGMNGYVMKPFIPSELYAKIKGFLR